MPADRRLARRVAAILCGGLCLASAAAAQSSDPFDLLFGEGEDIDADASDKAGRDDLKIVGLELRRLSLNPAAAAFDGPNGLYLPLKTVVDALEFPIAFTTDDIAEGWFISTDRTLRIDFARGEVLIAGARVSLDTDDILYTDDGWGLSLAALSRVFPIDFSYDGAFLAVDLAPREVLPLEARLEREALREELRTRRPAGLPDYPEIANPYRWLSLPVAEIDTALRVDAQSGLGARLSVEAAGDFLKTTARLRAFGGEDSLIDGFRFALERISEDASELGPLKARAVFLGDIAAPALPLLTEGAAGRGLAVTNRRAFQPDLFDTTEIRGPLPEGWEAELFDSGELIAFVVEPDANGDYVFEGVPLRPGLNRLEVRLYGPFGETEAIPQTFFIGSELFPENETSYAFGIVERGETLFSGAAADVEETGVQAYASVEHGVSPRLSVRADATVTFGDFDGARPAASAGAFFSEFGGFGAVRLASDGSGRPAIEAAFQRRILERSSVSASVGDFGGLETDATGFGPDRVTRFGDVRVDTALLVGARSLPLRLNLGWLETASGISRFEVNQSVASALRGVAWSHALSFRRTSDSFGSNTSLTGDFLVSKTLRGFRLRGAASYRLDGGFGFGPLNVTAQKRLGRNGGLAQVSLSQDINDGGTSISGSWSRPIGPATFAATFGAQTGGAVFAGVNLSFALAPRPRGAGYGFAPAGVSRTGAFRGRVFDDVDADGVFSDGDREVPGARFIVQNAVRREETGADGEVVVAGLQAGRRLAAELQLSSIDDPFLAPISPGRVLSVRPGQVVDVAFPLQITGEVEGNLLLKREGVETAVSGVTIQVVADDGRIVGEGRTEFDGYFYIDGVPAGDHQVRVNPDELASVGGASEAVAARISPDEPGVYGLSLLIKL